MEEFLQGITSAYWWLILLMGLIMGIIGNFFSDGIKKVIGIFSSRQREKNLEEGRRFDKQVDYLVNNPNEIINSKIDATYQRLLAIHDFILLAVVGFLSLMTLEFVQTKWLGIAISTLLFIFFIYLGFSYFKVARISRVNMEIARKALEIHKEKERKRKEEMKEDIPF